MEDGRFGAIAAIIRQVELTMVPRYGFIFLPPEAEPASDRVVIETGGFQATMVAVPQASSAVAVELVEGGAQLFELCGTFGPIWTGKVVEAIGGRAPVGSVAYGIEAVCALAALMRSDA